MLTIAQDSALPNPRRGWATLISFALQATALTVVLLVPLLQPGMLPRLDLTPRLVPLFLSPTGAPSASHPSSGESPVTPTTRAFTVPPSFPRHASSGPDTTPTGDDAPPCAGCIPGTGPATGIPGGMNVIGLPIPPMPTKAATKPPRVSVMMDGFLIHRVQPDYPILARQTRVQGPVEIAAVIGKEGAIENLRVVSGHPMLIRAALDAVKQWRYRPYILNGEPIEVDTRITVNFSLGGN
jgi:protein TonB